MPANTPRAGRVLCLGETMAMVTPTHVAPLREAVSFAVKAGGAESTVAMYLADSGVPSSWVSWLGDDPLGWRLLDEVRASGVDVAGVQLVPGAPTGVYFKDPGDGETTVYYYRAGSAASRMDATVLAQLDWEGVAALHVTGITAGLSASCSAMLEAVMLEARRRAITVSFDVNYRPGLWSIEAAGPRLATLAALADLVFVGRDEAETLWGEGHPATLHSRLGLHGSLVVKDGSVGATEVAVVDGSVSSAFVPAHPVDVVEAVGAGDAFTAGYLGAMLGGEPVDACLNRGHGLAARTLGSTHDFVPA
ncbi:sugar kinase [Pseudoclavibacter sp. RFBG4]|uniref:sugar kinase n=1 Tax=Pseudoclavibacter sp. RFBG4 TaxID=2080575 RepID=UPI00215707A1|nr:sugar kinase [Pseudoclavibacter sp. RFBG4]